VAIVDVYLQGTNQQNFIMENNILHNKAESRFELAIEDQVSFIDYLLDNQIINFTHTWVPTPLEGRGIAASLAKYALNFAAENNLQVIPSCVYIRVYIDRHPEYKLLLYKKP
jgi:predicted GNAT family acetyltransferase